MTPWTTKILKLIGLKTAITAMWQKLPCPNKSRLLLPWSVTSFSSFSQFLWHTSYLQLLYYTVWSLICFLIQEFFWQLLDQTWVRILLIQLLCENYFQPTSPNQILCSQLNKWHSQSTFRISKAINCSAIKTTVMVHWLVIQPILLIAFSWFRMWWRDTSTLLLWPHTDAPVSFLGWACRSS